MLYVYTWYNSHPSFFSPSGSFCLPFWEWTFHGLRCNSVVSQVTRAMDETFFAVSTGSVILFSISSSVVQIRSYLFVFLQSLFQRTSAFLVLDIKNVGVGMGISSEYLWKWLNFQCYRCMKGPNTRVLEIGSWKKSLGIPKVSGRHSQLCRVNVHVACLS